MPVTGATPEGRAGPQLATAPSKARAISWTVPSGSGVAKGTYSLELNAGTNIFVYFKMDDGAEVASATVYESLSPRAIDRASTFPAGACSAAHNFPAGN